MKEGLLIMLSILVLCSIILLLVITSKPNPIFIECAGIPKIFFEGEIYDTPEHFYQDVPHDYLTEEQAKNIEVVQIWICSTDDNYEEEMKKLEESQIW